MSTVICTLQIFEKRKWVCVYICATRTSMIDTLRATIEQQKKEERTEEEGDYVKKNHLPLCQSFYYDTVVI